MQSPIKVGSRGSRLAITQVEEVFHFLVPTVTYALTTFKTTGDKDQTTPLTAQPADNFFTDTIDTALLNNEIDVSIHSAKDLPKDLPTGLEIYALTPSIDDTDSWVSAKHLNQIPSGAKVGTSSYLRQKQIKDLYPDIKIVDIRGTIQERIALVDTNAIDGIIVATCALKRLKLDHLIKDVLPWEGMPLQGQLAIVGRAHQPWLKEIFAPLDARLKYGKVILVGAGPGDPDLITVKGITALSKANVVFYDYLVSTSLLKYAPNAEHVYAGKRKGDHTISQDQLSRMLKTKALEGKNVVRLKGGDPLIFGRGADEIQYLKSFHIQVEVVPGISSATGIPSLLGIPLTARGISSSVAFVSAHEEDEDLKGLQPVRIPKTDTIVFLMGLTKLKDIVQALNAAAWPMTTPIVIVSNGTRADEQIVQGDLGSIERLAAESNIKPPALIIAGKVNDLFKNNARKTYLHCGTHPHIYAPLGRIIPWPMIAIEPVTLDEQQKTQLGKDFDNADLIILTSPSAIEHFLPIIRGIRPAGAVKHKMIAVLGKHSADILKAQGAHASIISDVETAEGLFHTLRSIIAISGKNILFPRSSIPNPFLKESLVKCGAKVQEWPVYLNTKPKKRDLPNIDISGIIFTSPSTAKNFLEDYARIPKHWEILSKGPVTEAVLKKAGYTAKIIL